MCCCGECCFSGASQVCIAITGIILSVVNFGFSTWELAYLSFLRDLTRALYIIGFVFNIMILLGFIAILIFLFVRKGANYYTFNKIGKIICIAIRVMALLIVIFIIIHFIIQIKDIVDIEKVINYPAGDYAAFIIPTIVCLSLLTVIDMAARILFNRFSSEEIKPANTAQINQISVIPNENTIQTGMFPNNNVQPVVPGVPNNQMVNQ